MAAEKEKNQGEGAVVDEKSEARYNTESTLEGELKAGEWQRLSEFEKDKKRSRQVKRIAMIEAISNRITQLEKLFYQLVANHRQKAVALLAEMKRLRFLKEYLLQALIWEEQRELEAHDIPRELEGLI